MKVNIYGIEYEIKEVAEGNFYNNVGVNDYNDKNVNIGRHLGALQVILLNKNLKIDLKRTTLIHELAHAIIFVLGYEEMNEETIVQFVAAHHNLIQNIITEYFK